MMTQSYGWNQQRSQHSWNDKIRVNNKVTLTIALVITTSTLHTQILNQLVSVFWLLLVLLACDWKLKRFSHWAASLVSLQSRYSQGWWQECWWHLVTVSVSSHVAWQAAFKNSIKWSATSGSQVRYNHSWIQDLCDSSLDLDLKYYWGCGLGPDDFSRTFWYFVTLVAKC